MLDELYQTILARKNADPATSHTANLFARGDSAIARKVGEEAVETVVAALKGSKQELVSESADLLFHLLVLWAAKGLSPSDVMAELQRRQGTSGIEEKANRPKE